MAKRSGGPSNTEIDMTPMIDMTFQLITFFMFVMNFSEAEQDDRIQLPSSQLAKPADGVIEKPITLQLTNAGAVIYAGELVAVRDIGAYLELDDRRESRAELGDDHRAGRWPGENGGGAGHHPHLPRKGVRTVRPPGAV